MKKLLLILPIIASVLASCAFLESYNKPKEELYINVRTPHIHDMSFDKNNDLPKDIKNESYYDVDISGSALKNCEVRDYGDAKVKQPGRNKVFVGKANDWEIIRIDCSKDKGNGNSGEKHDLEIKIYTNDKVYHGKTELEHE